MGQVNVNPGPVERSSGTGAGITIGLLVGLILILLIGWYVATQSGWFGPAGGAARPSTNVNITTNNPPATGGQPAGGGR